MDTIHSNTRGLLIDMLEGEFAHVNFDNAIKNIPLKYTGVKARGTPYTIWQLCEHIRIIQWDIVEFSINSKHLSPDWPDNYWPKEKSPSDSSPK